MQQLILRYTILLFFCFVLFFHFMKWPANTSVFHIPLVKMMYFSVHHTKKRDNNASEGFLFFFKNLKTQSFSVQQGCTLDPKCLFFSFFFFSSNLYFMSTQLRNWQGQKIYVFVYSYMMNSLLDRVKGTFVTLYANKVKASLHLTGDLYFSVTHRK